MHSWIVPSVFALLFVAYGALIIYYWLAWRSIPDYNCTNSQSLVRISVIIPARDEASNIPALIKSLQSQRYPHSSFESIIVDDHSTDDTARLVTDSNFSRLIQLTDDGLNSYKKKAIERAIESATNECIVTTDADCTANPLWLQTIADFQDKMQSVFIAAPVSFSHDRSLLSIFQELDFLVLQGITGASVQRQVHSMCNGANLAYSKAAFNEVHGFSGIDDIASGDDMLLMHKIWKKYPRRVHYLKSKDAIVSTPPMKTWRSFIQQRIRWASKATRYNDKRIIIVLLLVYLFNLSFLVLFVAGFFNHSYWIALAAGWFAKTAVELPFVWSVAKFFDKKRLLRYFFFFQPLHILYTILSGLLGQFGRYEWKGRRVR